MRGLPAFCHYKIPSFCRCRFLSGRSGVKVLGHNVLFSPSEDNRSFLPSPGRDSRKFIDDAHYRNSPTLLQQPPPPPPSSVLTDLNVGLIFPLSAFPFIYRANRVQLKLSSLALLYSKSSYDTELPIQIAFRLIVNLREKDNDRRIVESRE